MFIWLRKSILALALTASVAPAFAQSPTPVPALPDTERRTAYTISASTCVCSVNFALYGDSTDYQDWLEVWLNGTQLQYNDPVFGWTITSPTGPIGNIARPITDAVLTFSNPQTGTIQIVGARRPRRVSQFSENTGVPARNLNQVLTDIVAMLREAWDKINDVTGRVILAPPGETFPPLPPASQRANQSLCFDSSGNPKPCAITSSGAIAAGNGISVSGSNPATISSNIQGSGAIIVSGTNPLTVSCPTCTASSGGATLVSSRSIAATLNLSAFSVVQTGGYTTAGDGGGATFQKTTGAFQDSYITAGTIVGGSGYVNGTYYVAFSGGTGTSCAVQAVVSGGVVTTINFDIPCPSFTVGDVLTISNSQLGGSGSGFSYTVTTMSAAGASFTDAVGNKWQYVTDQNVSPNVRQFGAALNWAGNDATATNDAPAFYSAIAFASNQSSALAALVFGGTVNVPKGAALICGQFLNAPTALMVPQSVTLRGAGSYGGTSLHLCTAEASSNHFVTLCGIYTTRGQINCAIRDMSLTADPAGAVTNNVAMIYSSSGQQHNPLVSNMWIIHGLRGCIYYEKGIGGAAVAFFDHIECDTNASTISNNAVTVAANVGSTIVTFDHMVIECSGPCTANTGLAALGGSVVVNDMHQEGMADPFTILTPNQASFRNITIGPSCQVVFTLGSGTPANGVLFENVNSGSCPNIIANGHGSNYNIGIVKQVTCGSTCG